MPNLEKYVRTKLMQGANANETIIKAKTHIVSVSGGAASTLAAHRVMERYGQDHLLLIFADTQTEDESLYRLLDALEARLPDAVMMRLKGIGDIWDVFDHHGIIRTPTGACKASIELKHKPIARYVAEHFEPTNCVIYTGMDHTEALPGTRGEPSRQSRFEKRWQPYRVEHPLNWLPHLSACEIIERINDLDYPEQTLYDRGYPHNNCGGACVLAGLGQWHGLYLDAPDRYAYHEERERQFNARYRKNRKPFTVLRNQAARVVDDGEGATKMQRSVEPITLSEFRERIERNDQSLNLRDFRSTCGCIHAAQGNLFETTAES